MGLGGGGNLGRSARLYKALVGTRHCPFSRFRLRPHARSVPDFHVSVGLPAAISMRSNA
ncbi:MAG: hypothetical protein R2843_05205 [Thermomicrobiales bacterium]